MTASATGFRSPLPSQVAALHYALPRKQIALFMEMRLGKTLAAIRWAMKHSTGPHLVIAPLTVLHSWFEELRQEHIPEHEICILRADEGYGSWHLTNYEHVRAHPELLHAPWKTIICDESTRIRNPKAAITKLLTRETSHIPHRAILSGLPAPESPLDYFEQFNFLFGSMMNHTNYWAFRQEYFLGDANGWEWWPKAGTLAAMKAHIYEHAFVLTRKQAGIGSKKVYETRCIPMTPTQRQVYRRALKDFELQLKDGVKLTQYTITQLLWLARIAGGYSSDEENTVWSTKKTDECINLLLGELAQEPVVIWCRFNREIRELTRRLGRRVPHVIITGATTLADRRLRLKMFQGGVARILIAQVKCAKFGLDCSRASTAIYFSNGYDHEDRAQSEDRIVHPKKREPLLYLDLVTDGTVDALVINALREKKVTSRVLMTKLLSDIHERVLRGRL